MRPVWAGLLHAGRKTDEVFGNYANAPKNRLWRVRWNSVCLLRTGSTLISSLDGIVSPKLGAALFRHYKIALRQTSEVTEKDNVKQERGRGEVFADILVRKSETTREFRCFMVNEKLMLK